MLPPVLYVYIIEGDYDMYKKPLPPAHLLHEMLHYDPETGDLRWKVRLHHTCSKGVIDAAGHQHGYRVVTLWGETYLQHRIIWVMQTGEAPPGDLVIDHIDENPGNNRWDNLRLLDNSTNVSRSSKHIRAPIVCLTPQGNWKAWRGREYVGTFLSEADAREADPTKTVDLRRNVEPVVRVKRAKNGHSWEARVHINGVRRHIGTFRTKEEALAAEVPPTPTL